MCGYNQRYASKYTEGTHAASHASTQMSREKKPPRKNINPNPCTHHVLGIDVGTAFQECSHLAQVSVDGCQVQRCASELQ